MAKSETQKIKKELSKELDSKRYEHTLGVAYTASCLAMRYDYDITKAYIAGLLHDCAKNFSGQEGITGTADGEPDRDRQIRAGGFNHRNPGIARG